MSAFSLSDATTITFTVVGFFVFLAVLAVARSALRKERKHYPRVRIGLFIERDSGEEKAEEKETP